MDIVVRRQSVIETYLFRYFWAQELCATRLRRGCLIFTSAPASISNDIAQYVHCGELLQTRGLSMNTFIVDLPVNDGSR